MSGNNHSDSISTLFTCLKLGVAIAVLVVMAGKFSKLWQANSGQEIVRESIHKMFPEEK